MQTIRPCLWFDTQGEEAAKFYTSIFPNSKIVEVTRYGSAGPRAEGTVMTVTFELDGEEFVALNGGPGLHLQRGDLARGRLRVAGGRRPVLGRAHRGWGSGTLRMAQGPVRRVLADHADGALRVDRRPRP